MKGTVIEQLGALPRVVDSLRRPKPGPAQILVKSLYLAINPVDGFIANTGMLVVEWPVVIGVDASGVIVEVGDEASSKYGFNVGDYVFGCTRIGMIEYAAGQESVDAYSDLKKIAKYRRYFLMDANVTMHKPDNVDLKQTAALGVGIETAALCIFDGLQVDLFDVNQLPAKKGEWVVVLGGASSVGFYAIQLLQLAGYHVVASCSSKSADIVQALGAETFNYKADVGGQLECIIQVTKGNVSRVFDAAASEDPILAKKLFEHDALKDKEKLFSTTNDWSGVTNFSGGKTYNVELGPIGRSDATKLNQTLESYIPVLTKLVENGQIKVGEYEVIGDGGFEDIAKAYKYKNSGAAGSKKVVVKVQNE